MNNLVKRILTVPTGHIGIMSGNAGDLEFLSLGDYGKDANIKASFMGLDNPIKDVPHQELLPLSKKWVVTISTQYGCSMGCKFCDVPKVGWGRNASHDDLINQIECAVSLHPEITETERLNIHYARMGEPTWNKNVINATYVLKDKYPKFKVHPVVSTMMPNANQHLYEFLKDWMNIKNNIYEGDAGLQLSINSTNDHQRDWMFNSSTLDLQHISAMMDYLPPPVGRKITLNFAVCDYVINGARLAKLFSPDKFMVKLTPMHRTKAAVANGMETQGEFSSSYSYEEIEHDLKKNGFDVLVFLASDIEDMSRITCGNAILAGTHPECKYEDRLVSALH